MKESNVAKAKILEENYKWLWELGINENSVITINKQYKDKVTGEMREIDVFVESYEDGKLASTTMIECRNRENVQDVTWVEQVVTKKNDLKIDRAIMVTASSFTNPARIKAKYYNIELEKSSKLSKEFIDKQVLSCKGKANFLFMECTNVTVYSDKGVYSYSKDNKLSSYIKNEIIKFSESDAFVTTVQDEILLKPENKMFYDNLKNYLEVNFSFDLEDENKENIKKILFNLKISPKSIEIPLTRVITIFYEDVEKLGENKRHKSIYENEDVRICFQIHESNMYNEITLKRVRRYWRFINFEATIFALLNGVKNENMTFKLMNSPKELLGEIYFGDLCD